MSDIYVQAATALKCEVAAVRAVAEVESRGSGFLPSGKCKILFEAHIFSRLTGHKYDKSHPHISSRKWNKALYKGGEREWARLGEAIALDRNAALQSASYGKFQVMGFNYQVCGYKTLDAFLIDTATEAGHLTMFLGYVKARGLVDELQRKDWAGFALGFNGAGYAANHYDTKMAAAYRKYST